MVGTLDATLETRGKFSHHFSFDVPWLIEKGYEPMQKGFSWKWVSLNGFSFTVKEGEFGN